MSVVIQELGYCQYDYAQENYCSGIVDQADGFQFRAVVTQEKNTGVQWRQRIDLAPVYGIQFRGLITQDAVRGFQFKGLNSGAPTIGAQWQQRVDLSPAAGLQFRGVNTQEPARGVQFSGANSVTLTRGMQFRARIDDAKTLGVQWRGTIADASLVRGMQWRQRVDQAPVVGVQYRALNSPAPARGVQFRASKAWSMYQCGPGYLSDEPYLTEAAYLAASICATGGFQFRLQNIVTAPKGIQWKQHLDSSRTYGVQFKGRLTKERNYGFQFNGIQAKPVAFQFRVAIYNSTGLRILADFPSRGINGSNWTATSTASSTTSAFSANNVNSDIVEQAWRSTASPGSAILTCDTQVTQGVFLDTLAILNHNFGGNTIVQLERSTNGITWALEANLIVERENMYYIAPSLPLSAYRYWRIVMSDSNISYFQIGTIVFGSSIVFQGEGFMDSVTYGKKQFSDKVFTEGHTNVANDRGKKKTLKLEFSNLNYGRANYRQLTDLYESAGTLLKCLYIPTPKTPSRFALFGKIAEIPEETHNTKGDDYVNLSINVDESL